MGSFDQRRKRERDASRLPSEHSTKVRKLNQIPKSHGRAQRHPDASQPRHTRLTDRERGQLFAIGGCFYCRKVPNPPHKGWGCPERPAAREESSSLNRQASSDRNYSIRSLRAKEEVGEAFPLKSVAIDLEAPAEGPEHGLDGWSDISDLSDVCLSDVSDDYQPSNWTKITKEDGPPGSSYRFTFGKCKGESVLERSPKKDEYITWMKNEHLPLQQGKEDLAQGIEYYHKDQLAIFEKAHPDASMYLFESGPFKSQCITDVPDWYIHQLEEEQSRFDLRLRNAIKWRTMLLNTNRWMWSVGKAWSQPKKKGVHRIEFEWHPKNLGPFLYPTTLPVESMCGDGQHPCVCPMCSWRLQGSTAEPKERPSDISRRRREEQEDFMYYDGW